jgi:exodeoxyribonuclease VII small subunit
MTEAKPVEELSYEEAFAELQTLVARLEGSDLPLETSLKLFERGQALAARCAQLLDEAELRVRQLLPTEEGGVEEVDFPDAQNL